MDTRRGVSCLFYSTAVKALTKIYGEREADIPLMEEFRKSLERAEAIFAAMPKWEKLKRTRSKQDATLH